MLDTKYRSTGYSLVSVGSLNESIAHPREIYRAAVVAGAYAIILMHNHPSGDCAPSQTDHSLTRRITEAGEVLGVKLMDHVIIGRKGDNRGTSYFSFREAGVI